MTCDHLTKIGELILEDKNKVYLPAFFCAEIGLAKIPENKKAKNEANRSEEE